MRQLTRCELVRARDRDHPIDSGQPLQAHLADALGIPDGADRRCQLARHDLCVDAARLEPLDHGLDIRRSRLRRHHDHHAPTSARALGERTMVTTSSATTPSENGRITAIGRLPSQTPGTEPSRIMPASPKSLLWRRSISIVSRSSMRYRNARTSVAAPVSSSAMLEIVRSTVFWVQCLYPPTVFVTAAYARSVPMAVVGVTPKTRISIGVISDPPPMPVMPTRIPTPRPKATRAKSTCRSLDGDPPRGPCLHRRCHWSTRR